MNVGDLAALIAALVFAVLVGLLAVPLIKLGGVFDEVDSKAREFGGALVDGYKQREAELRAAVAKSDDAY